MAENRDVRAAQERMRRQLYESGGAAAVKAGEKHIQATTRTLESELRRREGGR